MLNLKFYLESRRFFFKNLKVSNKTLIYLYAIILKKKNTTLAFRNLNLNKSYVIIKAPFHYKNSKKKVYENCVNTVLYLKVRGSFKKNFIFFFRKLFLQNSGFFKINKTVIAVK